MGTGPEFASQAEAAEAVLAGLGYLAALDLTQLPACAQAELLRILEQAHAMETAARAQGLRAFASGQGYHEDGCYGSARSWLTNRTRGHQAGAAAAYTGGSQARRPTLTRGSSPRWPSGRSRSPSPVLSATGPIGSRSIAGTPPT